MGQVLIGIDDTDMPGTPGTGRVARELAASLQGLGLGRSLGVTRHQLLVHPDIPYTSHNSSLCIGMETEAPVAKLGYACLGYVTTRMVQGSDPGLCVGLASEVDQGAREFGRRATVEVLKMDEAFRVSKTSELWLTAVGGTGLGVIGALAGVGLRAAGMDGRFVEMRGIRAVEGVVSVRELKQRTEIVSVRDTSGVELSDGELVDSLGWVRPSLVGGQAVLKVKRHPQMEKGWVPVERKHDKGGQQVAGQAI